MNRKNILHIMITTIILFYHPLIPSNRAELLEKIEIQSRDIDILTGIVRRKKQVEQYEFNNQNNIVKETYFSNGSYLITTFDKENAQAIESRFYEMIGAYCVNTKLIKHHEDQSNDVHEYNFNSGNIISKKYRPLENPANLFIPDEQPEKHALFTLDDAVFKLKPTFRSIMQEQNNKDDDLPDCKENRENTSSSEEKVTELIKKAQIYHRLGKEINIIEIKK